MRFSRSILNNSCNQKNVGIDEKRTQCERWRSVFMHSTWCRYRVHDSRADTRRRAHTCTKRARTKHSPRDCRSAPAFTNVACQTCSLITRAPVTVHRVWRARCPCMRARTLCRRHEPTVSIDGRNSSLANGQPKRFATREIRAGYYRPRFR